jgi:hypothetical protein
VSIAAEFDIEPMTEEQAEAILTAPVQEAPPEAPATPPKRGRGRPPGSKNKPKPAGGPAGADRPPAAPGRRPRTTRRPTSRATDYAGQLTTALQVPAAILAVVATSTENEALLADSLTLTHYAPAFANALGELATEKPEFAAALDRITKASPYGSLLVVAIPFALQLATNHGRVPPAKNLGVVSRDELIAAAGVAAAAGE